MSQLPPQGPDHRIVLLGASNLTLGLPRIVNALRSSLPGTIEVMAAHGHGRSYLKWSYVVHRGLPSIRDCDLWKDLKSRPTAAQTYALVTDLGCDLFYGSKPHPIVESATACLRSLADIDARIILARPPLERLNNLKTWEYYLAKNTFFPGPTIPWPTMKDYIHEVDAGVSQYAKELGADHISPPRNWYGIDPIHIRRTMRNQAWKEILSAWRFPHALGVKTPSLSLSLRTWSCKAAESRFVRIARTQPQPVCRWNDGSSLSVY